MFLCILIRAALVIALLVQDLSAVYAKHPLGIKVCGIGKWFHEGSGGCQAAGSPQYSGASDSVVFCYPFGQLPVSLDFT